MVGRSSTTTDRPHDALPETGAAVPRCDSDLKCLGLCCHLAGGLAHDGEAPESCAPTHDVSIESVSGSPVSRLRPAEAASRISHSRRS